MSVVPGTQSRAGHCPGSDNDRAKQGGVPGRRAGRALPDWLAESACLSHRAGRDPETSHVASLTWTGLSWAQGRQDPARILLASPNLHGAVHSS